MGSEEEDMMPNTRKRQKDRVPYVYTAVASTLEGILPDKPFYIFIL